MIVRHVRPWMVVATVIYLAGVQVVCSVFAFYRYKRVRAYGKFEKQMKVLAPLSDPLRSILARNVEEQLKRELERWTLW